MDRTYKIQSIKLKRKKERFQNFLLQRKDYFLEQVNEVISQYNFLFQVNEEMNKEEELNEIDIEEEEDKKDEETYQTVAKNWRIIEQLKEMVRRENKDNEKENIDSSINFIGVWNRFSPQSFMAAGFIT